MAIRRLHPVRPEAREDHFAAVKPDGTPGITPAINLEELCELLDNLPDGADEVCVVFTEQTIKCFWRADTGDWNDGGDLTHPRLPGA